MKHFFLILSVLFSVMFFHPIEAQGQGRTKTLFSYCKNINGYWGEWDVSNWVEDMLPSYRQDRFYFNGSVNDFVIHHNSDHPSQYVMRIIVNNLEIDTNKKSKKQRIKDNTWYEYTGTVEYYTELTFQNFGDIIEHWPFSKWKTSNGKKHVVNAIIKIAPYKDYPKVYHIFFENYGVAISVATNT